MNQPVPSFKGHIYQTPNTKLAAALLTLGINFFNEEPVSNVYDANKPYRKGAPGNVVYTFVMRAVSGLLARDLVDAWNAATADKELDALVDKLTEAAKGNSVMEKLVRELVELLPKAFICYEKGALENRERILDMWKKAKPMVLFRKANNAFVLVNARASDQLKRQLGVPPEAFKS